MAEFKTYTRKDTVRAILIDGTAAAAQVACEELRRRGASNPSVKSEQRDEWGQRPRRRFWVQTWPQLDVTHSAGMCNDEYVVFLSAGPAFSAYPRDEFEQRYEETT